MTFHFSVKSENKLRQAHPNLQVLARAVIAESPIDFGILWSGRTLLEQQKLYAQGRTREELDKVGIRLAPIPGKKVTWTLNSKHILVNGYSRAIDIGVYLNGVYQNGDTPSEQKFYFELADLFKKKNRELGLNVSWGPDVGIPGDIGHYEVP